MKVCSKCKEVKPKSEFYPRPSRPCGVTSSCKKCQGVKVKGWRLANADQNRKNKNKWNAANADRINLSRRLRKYGLETEEFEALFKFQGGACAICRDPLKTRGKDGLAIDHVHGTNPVMVRGLLCCRCNTGIGNLQDSLQILFAAAEYLRKADPLPAGLMPCH